MTSEPRASSEGFTLIEMLIALLIFAMISAAGVIMLRGTLNSQVASDRQLDGLQEVQRLRAILSQDVGQMAIRPWRDGSGAMQPAFSKNSTAGLIAFVRHGWSNPAGDARSSLQRVSYRIDSGNLVRVSTDHVDGNVQERISKLVANVQQVDVELRGRDGVWSSDWRGASPADLPRAVRLTLQRQGEPTIKMAFAVGVEAPLPKPRTGELPS